MAIPQRGNASAFEKIVNSEFTRAQEKNRMINDFLRIGGTNLKGPMAGLSWWL
jgi:hypothetical protein